MEACEVGEEDKMRKQRSRDERGRPQTSETVKMA